MRSHLIVLTIAACLTAFAQERRQQEDRDFENLGFADPALVVAWNQIVNDIAFAEDQFLTFKGVRAHAMMHIAMHDALNAVIPLYRQYEYRGQESVANPIVAAAQAAHDVVVHEYPNQQAKADAELRKWLSQAPDGPHKMRGIALGGWSAAAILALRASDGWNFLGTHTFSSALGAYQTTPPWNGFVVQPGFRYATPFGLRSLVQFRPAPPPPLGSPEYARAYNEVKDFGRTDSVLRAPDQSLYAIWWMEFAEGSVNRLARQLSTKRRNRGGARWQPGYRGGFELGAAPDDSAVPRIRLRPLHRVRGLI